MAEKGMCNSCNMICNLIMSLQIHKNELNIIDKLGLITVNSCLVVNVDFEIVAK